MEKSMTKKMTEMYVENKIEFGTLHSLETFN